MILYLKKPKDFNFRNAIFSHGWCELAPFAIDEENWILSNVFKLENARKPVFTTISETPERLKIEVSASNVGKKAQSELILQVKHILRFSENYEEFYKLTKKTKSFEWISTTQSGRLLRSPGVFEDLVKTICTTNCSWSFTKSMVNNLVESLGEETISGQRSFPSAEAMAAMNEDFYRKEIRAGYRSPYFLELAELVASGKLDPENWIESELETPELKKEIKGVKGVGEYAAENLLKLLGRFEGLALDSWLRSEFSKQHNGGKKASDKKIEKFYAKFGKWQGLAIWFDMSRRWLD